MTALNVQTCHTPPAEWDNFVINHPQGKIYHLSKWQDVIHKTFKHTTQFLVLKNDNAVEGVLPLTHFKSLLFGKFAVSLPFINYGGALINNENSAAIFLDFLNTLRDQQKFDFIELRQFSGIQTTAPCKSHKVTFILDLPKSADDLLNSFKAKLRSQIRRPLKEDMYAQKGGLERLDDFYRIFSKNMRDLGTPVLPKKLFRNILEQFPEQTFIVTVHLKNGYTVAASFLICFKGVCEIPWASSLNEYNRFSPNMLLYWESLRLAIDQKCEQFDFGRCSPDSGTYQFKKQWGGQEKQLYWYYVLPEGTEVPNINPANPKYSLLIKTWQKLPLFFANFAGPMIIKHIP